MIDLTVVITGCIGLATTVLGSVTSWFISRKRYNTEVDSNEIDNLKKSLEFYENIVKDNNEKLQFYIKVSENNRVEVYRLKSIVHRLLNNSCIDSQCIKRVFFTEAQIREILGETSPKEEIKNIEEYETETRKETI